MSTLRVDNLQGQTAGTNRYVVQVVYASFTSRSTITSNGTYTDTHITADITPSSTSNKVLVLINTAISVDNVAQFRNFKIGRGGTAVSDNKIIRSGYADTGGADLQDFTMNYLDSPSSTSSVTYSLMAESGGEDLAVGGRLSATNGNQLSTITLMEIAQ
jgi:hypothetical protein